MSQGRPSYATSLCCCPMSPCQTGGDLIYIDFTSTQTFAAACAAQGQGQESAMRVCDVALLLNTPWSAEQQAHVAPGPSPGLPALDPGPGGTEQELNEVQLQGGEAAGALTGPSL